MGWEGLGRVASSCCLTLFGELFEVERSRLGILDKVSGDAVFELMACCKASFWPYGFDMFWAVALAVLTDGSAAVGPFPSLCTDILRFTFLSVWGVPLRPPALCGCLSDSDEEFCPMVGLCQESSPNGVLREVEVVRSTLAAQV